ncbi:MAG: GNAT family N-acetyltransferase [Acidobacteriota bacterium]|nr:GNAT family N-acetyltransferase [Acidobacteriota bacterium]
MEIRIRPATPDDAEACGRIIYEAFKGVAERHNFRPDFPSADAGAQLAHLFINDPAVFGVVAESGGRVVGSNFLSEWDPVRGVGPITIDPELQARGVGRRLMEAVVERGRGAAGASRALIRTHELAAPPGAPPDVRPGGPFSRALRRALTAIGGRVGGAPPREASAIIALCLSISSRGRPARRSDEVEVFI